MESINDVKAFVELQKIDRVQRIEKKIYWLSFMPAYTLAIIMAYVFWLLFSDYNSWSPIHLLVVGAAVSGIGQSNVKRTDLMLQLFELKYGK